MSYDVGTAHLTILPSFRGFATSVDAEMARIGRQAGDVFGRAWGDAAGRSSNGINLGPGNTGSARQGSSQGGAFGDAFRARVQAALRDLPSPNINLRTDADRVLARIRVELRDLASQRIGIDVDAGAAQAKLATLEAELRQIASSSPDVRVRVDAGAAAAELAALQAEVSRLDGQDVDIDVDRHGSIASAGAGISGLLAGILTLGPALIPIGAAAVAGIGAIGIAAGASIGAVGVLALGLSGVSGAVKALGGMQAAQEQDAQRAAVAATARAAAQEGAARQLEGAEASLASARRQAAEGAVQAAERVAEARRQLADAEQAAARRVDDAERTLAETQEQRTRAVLEARRQLVDAERQAADSIDRALQAQERAERDLLDAQRSAQQAQEDLNDARKEAARQLEDLTARVRDGALDQRQAVLDVQDAQQRLNETLADPKATEAQRAQAQLTFEQAQAHLDELTASNARLAEEQAAAAAAGVEGSDLVTAAQQRIEQANQRVADAQQGSAAAAGEVAKAQQDGAEKVLRAQERLGQVQSDSDRRVTDAQRALVTAQQEGAKQIEDAQRRIGDAVRAQTQQQEQSAAAVAQAQRQVETALAAVEKASHSAGQVGETAVEKLQRKLDGLSPAGLAFAKFINDTLKPAFNGLRDTAQEGLLPGLQSGLQNLIPLMPAVKALVATLAKAMGDLFAEAGRALGSPFWRNFFTFMQQTAGPIITGIGHVLGNLAQGFAGLLEAFLPVSQSMGAGILNLSERFAAFGANTTGSSGFQGFMAYLQEALPRVADFFVSLGTTVGHLIDAFAPIGLVVLGAIKGLSDVINIIPVNVLGALAAGIIAVVAAMKLWELATKTLTAVQLLLDFALNDNPIGALILLITGLVAAFVYAYKNSETFRDIVNAVFKAVSVAVGAFVDFFVHDVPAAFSAVYDFVAGFFKAHWDLVAAILFGPLGLAVREIIKHWDDIRGAFSDAVAWVTTTFAGAWSATTGAITGAVSAAATTVSRLWSDIRGFFSAAYDWVVGFFSDHWALIAGVLTGPVGAAVIAIGTHWGEITKGFNDVKDWVLGAFRTAWNGIKAVLTAPVSAAVDFIGAILGAEKGGLQSAFALAVAGIGRVWKGLEELAKAPIRFIVETVLNSGLIDAFDWVSDRVGGPHIKHFELPTGFATGGVLPGYAPGQDSVLAMLSPGESVLRPEVTRALGAGTINAWNAAAMSGQLPRFATGVGDFLGAAGGALAGIFGSLDPLDWLKEKLGGALGGLSSLTSNAFGQIVAAVPRKLVEALLDAAKHLVGGLLPDFLGGGGEHPGQRGLLGPAGPGDFPSLIAYLQSTGLPFRVNSTTGGEHAAGSYHYAGRAVDFGPAGLSSGSSAGQAVMQRIFDAFLPIAAQLKELFFTNAVEGFNVKNGQRIGLFPDHRDHVHVAYDQGGLLQPGITSIVNGLGRPEMILTPSQWSTMAALAARSATGGVAAFQGDLYLDTGEFLGVVRGQASEVLDGRLDRAVTAQRQGVPGGALEHLQVL